MAVDPSGKFAYAADGGAFPASSFGGSSSVSMYTIDSTTGALTSIGITAAGDKSRLRGRGSCGQVRLCDEFQLERRLDVHHQRHDWGLNVHRDDRCGNNLLTSVVVHPSGKFAYVANCGSNDVSMYTINATTGALTSIGTIAAGTSPVSMAVDPAGKFAYVANFTETN